MTAWLRRRFAPGSRPRPTMLVLLTLLIVLGVVGVATGVTKRDEARPERHITLVARDMAFYLPGDATPNPRLLAFRGETLRLTLRNEDAGMAHDLALASLGERTAVARDALQTVELALRALDEAGAHDYVCTLHPQMMRGVLVVR